MPILIRPLQVDERSTADAIFRFAFGTFIGLPDPSQFAFGCNYMNRWLMDPTAALAAVAVENAAEADSGQVIGSNIAVRWGSFGFFGPLTVHPNYWNQQVGQQLVAAAIDCFDRWNVTHAGLFTFPNSPKHLVLYQKFGFYPRFLTPVLGKPIQASSATLQALCFSSLTQEQQTEALQACAELTDSLYNGLDLTTEIQAAAQHHLGETLLLWSGDRLAGFAVCHCGADTEAGPGNCYIKFGAVRSGQQAEADFEQLLQECSIFGHTQGLTQLLGGVNLEREAAYRKMRAMGFQITIMGIAMCRPNQPRWNRSDVFAIDDWR